MLKPKYISLEPYILWEFEERPIQWEQKFGRSADIEVEIGFGLGDFLVSQAKKHPEKYKDLVVRVGGFSAYFVTLSPEVQDELIRRTESTF